MFKLAVFFTFIVFSSSSLASTLVTDCKNVDIDDYHSSLSVLHEDWLSEVRYLRFCDVHGKNKLMSGYLSEKVSISDYHLIETVAPRWLAISKERRRDIRYYHMVSCLEICDYESLIEADSILLRVNAPLEEHEESYLPDLFDLVDCIGESSCLNEIIQDVSFFRALFNRWRDDLSKITASDSVNVVEIDLLVSDKQKIEFYISSNDGNWLLVFDRKLSKRKLLGLYKVH